MKKRKKYIYIAKASHGLVWMEEKTCDLKKTKTVKLFLEKKKLEKREILFCSNNFNNLTYKEGKHVHMNSAEKSRKIGG